MTYRALTQDEIRILETQGCYSENWQGVQVTDPFIPRRLRQVHFLGSVRIGILTPPAASPVETKPLGLYNCRLQDCCIGNHVLLENVGMLANYQVGDRATLLNVHSITMSGSSTFGNGVEIEALNEGGGRALKIFDHLSAQLAALLVLFRHDQALIECLNALIDEYVQQKTGSQGVIGSDTLIQDSGTISHLYVYPYTRIIGAQRLDNGTVVSESSAPSLIGAGVCARNFILQSGSRLDTQAVVQSCFIGQGVRLERQCSAENSAFFANCEFMHGEACSVFAGPYTVSHHKSTLLIAVMLSFFNAGSGSNQSNHMYKLGPIHQGILERGSKTGSFSYLLLPSRVGPFSVVIGKHSVNFDTTDLPFSYLNEEDGRSVLTPAMNLFTVGTLRDSQKWLKRDRRSGALKLDLINYDLWNPFIIEKVVKAEEILDSLMQASDRKQEYINYNGVSIKRLLLKTCRKYYSLAVAIFIGEMLCQRLSMLKNVGSFRELKDRISPPTRPTLFSWCDLAGWIVPVYELEALVERIRRRSLHSTDELHAEMRTIFNRYLADAWSWCGGLIKKRMSKDLSKMNKQELLELITDWRDKKNKLNHMVIQDAGKEFDENARIAYGFGCGPETRAQDFQAVRGTMESNPFIQNQQAEINHTDMTANQLCEWITHLPE